MARRNLATELDEVLCCPLIPNDTRAQTVGEYLLLSLSALWEKGEMFSGKRPLGYTDWEEILYISLAEEGIISATVDDEGEYIKLDRTHGKKLIAQAIMSMWSAGK